MFDLTGHTLKGYHLRERIGSGGFGAVYRAYQPSLDRDVAIKVLPPAIAAESGLTARFEREAKVIAALEHPHIVPIHDYGTEGDLNFIVMRLLTGGTLKRRLNELFESTNPMPAPTEFVPMLVQIAGALDYAHSLGIIHRDIKPGNVMFDGRGDAYLVDFGIAKLAQATQSLTSEAAMLGTPTYMAPEQWLNEPLTGAADQYGLAVMLFIMLTAKPPFEAATPYALMNQHLHALIVPLQTHRPELPNSINPVLERALSKDPGDRFPTVTAFVQAFAHALDDTAPAEDSGDMLVVFESIEPEAAPLASTPPHAALPVTPTAGHAASTASQFDSTAHLPQTETFAAPTPPTRGRSLLPLIAVLIVGGFAVLYVLLRPPATNPPLPTPTIHASAEAALAPTRAETAAPALTESVSATPLGTAPVLTADDYYVLGDEAYYDNELDTAIFYYTRAIELDPGDTDAYYSRGLSLYWRGDYEQAKSDFTQAIAMDPKYEEAFYYRGLIASTLGNYESAIADFTSALTLDPKNEESYFQRGLAYSYWEKDAEAIADFTSAIELDPQLDEAYYARAMSYNLTEDYAKAIDDFTVVLERDPNDADSYIGRGEAYEESGNDEAALADYQHAIEIDPHEEDYYTWLGDLLYDMKRTDEALAAYQTYLELAGNDAEGYIAKRVEELQSSGS